MILPGLFHIKTVDMVDLVPIPISYWNSNQLLFSTHSSSFLKPWFWSLWPSWTSLRHASLSKRENVMASFNSQKFGWVKLIHGDFPGGPVGKTPCSQCRGLGSISGRGTRSRMLQLRVHMLQLRSPHATTKKSHATTKRSHMP